MLKDNNSTPKNKVKNAKLTPIVEIFVHETEDSENSYSKSSISTAIILLDDQQPLKDKISTDRKSFESCDTRNNQTDLTISSFKYSHHLVNIQEDNNVDIVVCIDPNIRRRKYFYAKCAIGVVAATSLIVVNCMKDSISSNKESVLFSVNLCGIIGVFSSVCSIVADEKAYIKHIYNNFSDYFFSKSSRSTSISNQNNAARLTHSLGMEHSSNSHLSISKNQAINI